MTNTVATIWSRGRLSIHSRGFKNNHRWRVTFWKNDRGYGFVKRDDGGGDVFVHMSAVQRAGIKALEVGQHLSFDAAPDPYNASRVRAVNLKEAARLQPRRGRAPSGRQRPCDPGTIIAVI
jgi:CspA family cold shock protein